jgi:TRAP-type C4-dicarboxylate transport system permease small subunit
MSPLRALGATIACLCSLASAWALAAGAWFYNTFCVFTCTIEQQRPDWWVWLLLVAAVCYTLLLPFLILHWRAQAPVDVATDDSERQAAELRSQLERA